MARINLRCGVSSSMLPGYLLHSNIHCHVLIWPLLPLTTMKPFGTVAQHLHSGFTVDDFAGSIMLVAGEIVSLGVIIVLLHTYYKKLL